jgi:hypothetical protein
MGPLAIVFGVLLSLIGIGFFASTGFEMSKATALIPVGFGIPLIVLGVIALNEKAKMHAMHGAAIVGLLGFLMPTVMVILGLARGGEFDTPKIEQTIMAALCGIFLGLCIKSFIDARIARKQREAAQLPPTQM